MSRLELQFNEALGQVQVQNLHNAQTNFSHDVQLAGQRRTTRKRLLTILAPLTLCLVSVGSAQTAGNSTLLVVNRGGGTVEVVGAPPDLLTTTYTPPAPADPYAVAFSPSPSLAVVTETLNSRIDFLNPLSTPPSTVGLSVSTAPISATSAAFSPSGACLVFSGFGDGTTTGSGVGSVDVSTRFVKSSFPTVGANGVEFVPYSNVVLVADQFNGQVHVFTMAADCSLTQGSPVTVNGGSGEPINITATPDGRRALVVDGAGAVDVLGITNESVALLGSIAVTHAQSIAVSPNGSQAFVNQCGAPIEILNIDSAGNVTDSATNLPAAASLCNVAKEIATDGINVYVNNTSNVNVISLASGTLTGTTAPGKNLRTLADFNTSDPAQNLANLLAAINNFGLPTGAAAALSTLSKTAQNGLSNGPTASACGALGAIVNFAQAQSGKQLTTSQADAIITGTTQLQLQVGCGSH